MPTGAQDFNFLDFLGNEPTDAGTESPAASPEPAGFDFSAFLEDSDPEPQSFIEGARIMEDPAGAAQWGKDTFNAFMGGAARVVETAGYLGQRFGAQLPVISDWVGMSESLNATIEGRQARPTEQVFDEEMGKVRQAGADASQHWIDRISDDYTKAMNASWGDDEFGATTIMAAAAMSAPEMMLTGGAGAQVGRLAALAGKVGVSRIAAAAAAGSERAKRILRYANYAPAVAGAAAGGATEGIMAAGASGAAIEDQVMAMSHEDLVANSSRYFDIYEAADGMDEDARREYARSTLAQEAGRSTAAMVGASTALLGTPTGGLMGHLATRGASELAGGALSRVLQGTVGGQAVAGAVAEGGQEFMQEGAQTFLQNLGIREYADKGQGLSDGVLDSAILGGLVGGVIGAPMAVAAGGEKRQQYRDEKGTAKPDGTPPTTGSRNPILEAKINEQLRQVSEAQVPAAEAMKVFRWAGQAGVRGAAGGRSALEFSKALEELAQTGRAPEAVQSAVGADIDENGTLTQAAYDKDAQLFDFAGELRITPEQAKTEAVLMALGEENATPYRLDDGTLVVPASAAGVDGLAAIGASITRRTGAPVQLIRKDGNANPDATHTNPAGTDAASALDPAALDPNAAGGAGAATAALDPNAAPLGADPANRNQARTATAGPLTPVDAGTVIDRRLAALREAEAGEIDNASFRALTKERDELDTLVREQDSLKDTLGTPSTRLTPEERATADARRAEVRAEIERGKTAAGARRQREELEARLAKIDNDDDLVALADSLQRPTRVSRVEDAVRDLPGVSVRRDATVVIEPGADGAAAMDAAGLAAATHPDSDYTEPTPRQAAAGNYAKGRVLLRGAAPGEDVRVVIENVPGSIRRSMPGAPKWSRKVKHHYGYIPGTKASDGDPVDVYLGRAAHDSALPVFVIRQLDTRTGEFDEPKVVMGYAEEGEAKAAYLSEYPRPSHEKLFGGITRMTRAQFNEWVRSGETDVPPDPISKKPMASLRKVARSFKGKVAKTSPTERGEVIELDLDEGGRNIGKAWTRYRVYDDGESELAIDLVEINPDARGGAGAEALRAAVEASLEGRPQPDVFTGEAMSRKIMRANIAAFGQPSVLNTEGSAKQLTVAQAMSKLPEDTPQDADGNMAVGDRAMRVYWEIPNRNRALENNGSGESSASIEAINRVRDEKAAGQARMLIERDGSVRPLVGVDAVDTFAREGQVIVQRGVGAEEWTAISQDPRMSREAVAARIAAAQGRLEDALVQDDDTDTDVEAIDFESVMKELSDARDDDFDTWFEGSIVAEGGQPKLVYRGQHGKGSGLQTKLGSISFGDLETANAYATDPNDTRDVAEEPKVLAAYLSIKNPAINNEDDPFVDVSVLAELLDMDPVEVAEKWGDHIVNTNNWDENYAPEWGYDVVGAVKADVSVASQLYLMAYPVFDDPEIIAKLKEKGYDGAIHVGSGTNGSETEYRVFDKSQVRVVEQTLLASLSERPPLRLVSDRTPLTGLPSRIRVDGRIVEFGPHKPARDAAKAYMEAAGLDYNPPRRYVKVNPVRARHLAAAYHVMPHNPQDPEVRAAYDAMITETLAQWEAIKATGLQVEFNPPGVDPYGNPRNAILDVVRNNHLYVFPTDEGFGSSDLDVSDNPLLAETDETWGGKRVLVNDVFRVVHDYFGHIKEGVGFRADGEENAWRSHAAMFSPLARRAMTTETRGQNSWVNFGPYGHKNRTAGPADTHYADQKIGLLPEWMSEDGMRGDGSMKPQPPPAYRPPQKVVDDALEMAARRLDGDGLKLLRRIELLLEPGQPYIRPVVLDRATMLTPSGPMPLPEGDAGEPIGIEAKLRVMGYISSVPAGNGILASLRNTSNERQVDPESSASSNDSSQGEAYPWRPGQPAPGVERGQRAAGGQGSDRPSFAQHRPAEHAVSLKAIHYSGLDRLKKLDASYAGSGSAGGERRRMGMGRYGKDAPAGDLKRRLYFYEQVGEELPQRESAVSGAHAYAVQLDNVYDLAEDPADIIGSVIEAYGPAAAQNMDLIEETINELGYDGMVTDPMAGMHARPIVLFGLKKKVPVAPAQAPISASLSTTTPAFRKWFGDSKVVDHDGNPLVVYHGAINKDGGFDVFNRLAGKYDTHGKSINAIGSWFTDSAEDSTVFSGSTNPERFAEGGQTVPVYLAIKNPFRVRNADGLTAMWQFQAGGDERLQNGDPEKFRAALIEQGYDGLVMEAQEIDRFTEEGSQFWVAFNPNQIKSAIANNGEYDPEQPSILASMTTQQDGPARVALDGTRSYGEDLVESHRVTAKQVEINAGENPIAAYRVAITVDGVERSNSVATIIRYGSDTDAEFLARVDQYGNYLADNLRSKNPKLFAEKKGGPKINAPEMAADVFPLPGLYSAMYHALQHEKGVPKKTTADKWRGWLDGAQRRGLFRKEEREWSGVDAMLDREAKKAEKTPVSFQVFRGDEVIAQMPERERADASAAEFNEKLPEGGRWSVRKIDNSHIGIEKLLDTIAESYPEIYEEKLEGEGSFGDDMRAELVEAMTEEHMSAWEWDGDNSYWVDEVEPDRPWAVYDSDDDIVQDFDDEDDARAWIEENVEEEDRDDYEVREVPSQFRVENNYSSDETYGNEDDADRRAEELNDDMRDEAYLQEEEWYTGQLDDDEIREWMHNRGDDVEEGAQYPEWASPNAIKNNYRELLYRVEDHSYESNHFDDYGHGLIMHTRVTDQFYNSDSGKTEKILFIEEHQSDLHQDAREQGFAMKPDAIEYDRAREEKDVASAAHDVTEKAIRDMVAALNGRPGITLTQSEITGLTSAIVEFGADFDAAKKTYWMSSASADMLNAIDALMAEQGADKINQMKQANSEALEVYRAAYQAVVTMENRANGVEPAPFHESWREVLMKNAMRYAALNNYDAVGWTSGFQQAERYRSGVSQAVDRLEWVPAPFAGEEKLRQAKEATFELIENEVEVYPQVGNAYEASAGQWFWPVDGALVPIKNPPKHADGTILGFFERDIDGKLVRKDGLEEFDRAVTEPLFDAAFARLEARIAEREELSQPRKETQYSVMFSAAIPLPTIGPYGSREEATRVGENTIANLIRRVEQDSVKSGHLYGYMGSDQRIDYEFDNEYKSVHLINGEEKTLKDLVGADIAEAIKADPTKPSTHDARMVVGGKGMILQYDKELPKIANKLGKSFGLKATRTDRLGLSPFMPGGTDGWRIDITPEFREFLAAPMPAYSLAGKMGSDKNLIEVRNRVDRIASRLRGAPPYSVVQNERGLPGHLARQIKSMGADGRIEGFLDPVSGRVFILADNIETRKGETQADAIERIFAEEVLGHYGLRAVFGNKALDSLLNQVWRDFRDDKRMASIVAQYGPAYGDPETNPAAARRMADEFLAKSDPNDQPGLWSMLVSWVRTGLRRLGFVRKWTDNDIRNLMERVFDSVRTGLVPTSLERLGTAIVETDTYEATTSVVRDGSGTRETEYRGGQRHVRTPRFVAAIMDGAEANLPAAEVTAFSGNLRELARFLGAEGKRRIVMPVGLASTTQLRKSGLDHQEIEGAVVVTIPTDLGLDRTPSFSLRNRKRGSADIEAIMEKTVAPPTSDLSFGQRLQQMFREATGYFGSADTWLELKTGWIDSAAAIEQMERGKFNGALLDAADSAYKMVSLVRNLPQLMAAVAKVGVPVYSNGTFVRQQGRKGLYEIFEPLWKTADGENLMYLWEGYAVARRSSQLINETNPDGTSKEKLLSQDEIDKLLALEQDHPEFKKVFDDWQEFNRQLLDLAVDRGAMSAEQAKLWKQNDYVPFFRVNEEEEVAAGITRKRGLSGQKVTSKRLTGSDRRIQPVMENVVMNTASILEKVYKNEAMNRIVALADGVAMTKEPMRMEPVKLSNADIARQLVKAGLFVGDDTNNTPEQRRAGRLLRDNDIDFAIRAVERMTPEQREQWTTFFRPARPEGNDIVSVMVDGKAVYYRVSDPLVLRAIVDMTPTNFGGLINLMGGAKRLLTTMVTLDPGFMMANWMRDTLSSWAVVNEDFHPMRTAIKDAVDIWTEEGFVEDLAVAGGMTGGFYNPTQDFGDVMRRVTKSDGIVLGTTRQLVDGYRRIGLESEQINRVAIARAVIARGGSLAEAAYQAQNVLNFSQHGDAVAAQLLIRTVPFLNARIQGLYRLYQGMKGLDGADPAKARLKFFYKAAILAGASMLLALKNMDDERYEKLPEHQKDTYWHVFIGDKHFAIPKPFEVGVLAATIPERIMRRIAGRDATKTTAKSIERALMDTFAFNPVPQLFKPIVEQWANRSFFTDRPIVGLSHEGLDPVAQYNPWTSETARGVATMLDQVVPDPAKRFVPETFRSPIRLEHALRAYLGTVGGYLLQMSDAALRTTGAFPEAPAMRDVTDLPAVGSALGRFYRGDPELDTSSKYQDDLYDALNEADAAYRTVNAYMNQGEIAKAQKHTAEHLDALRVRAVLHEFRKQAADINSMQRRIMDSRTMTAEQKRQQIDQLSIHKNRLMRQAGPYLALMGY